MSNQADQKVLGATSHGTPQAAPPAAAPASTPDAIHTTVLEDTNVYASAIPTAIATTRSRAAPR